MARAALSTPPVNAFSKAAKHKQTANEENLNLRFKVYLKDHTHHIVQCTYIREGTSLLSKAISLPINCKTLKLFPEGVTTDQTTPRRTFPVLSQGISFYSSLHWPGQRSISYHLWYIQAFAWKQITRFIFTELPFQDLLLAFGDFFNCVLCKLFIFQKILQGIAHATWKRVHNFHFSAIVLPLTIFPGKGDITKVTGSLTAPNRFRMLVGFSSELTGALFSASFLYQGSMLLCFIGWWQWWL